MRDALDKERARIQGAAEAVAMRMIASFDDELVQASMHGWRKLCTEKRHQRDLEANVKLTVFQALEMEKKLQAQHDTAMRDQLLKASSAAHAAAMKLIESDAGTLQDFVFQAWRHFWQLV